MDYQKYNFQSIKAEAKSKSNDAEKILVYKYWIKEAYQEYNQSGDIINHPVFDQIVKPCSTEIDFIKQAHEIRKKYSPVPDKPQTEEIEPATQLFQTRMINYLLEDNNERSADLKIKTQFFEHLFNRKSKAATITGNPVYNKFQDPLKGTTRENLLKVLEECKDWSIKLNKTTMANKISNDIEKLKQNKKI